MKTACSRDCRGHLYLFHQTNVSSKRGAMAVASGSGKNSSGVAMMCVALLNMLQCVCYIPGRNRRISA